MEMVGIIAEYNPFHSGHAWQIAEAKRLTGARWAVCVMSTVFTQRGDAAILPPADRVRMALLGGADAVFALPVQWAVRDAERFAAGGVHLLASLGCDALSFGMEQADIGLTRQVAALLTEETPSFRAALQAALAKGESHPAAVAAAAEACCPGAGRLLAEPNNTLAVCYLRAIRSLGAEMTAVPVPRTGSYRTTVLHGEASSAAAIRKAVFSGRSTLPEGVMPPAAEEILRAAAENGRLHRPEALDQALRYRLLTMTAADWAALPGRAEGLEERLRQAARVSTTRAGILLGAKTRRYPLARLSRICTCALLQTTQAQLDRTPLPPAAWLLGFRRESEGLLSEIKEKSSLPVIGKAADYPGKEEDWFRLETRAYDLWALGAGLPAGMAFTQGVVVV